MAAPCKICALRAASGRRRVGAAATSLPSSPPPPRDMCRHCLRHNSPGARRGAPGAAKRRAPPAASAPSESHAVGAARRSGTKANGAVFWARGGSRLLASAQICAPFSPQACSPLYRGRCTRYGLSTALAKGYSARDIPGQLRSAP
eukprot:scaffold6691_cov358-Prasinococcus_capsulatus_cf.AAC.25